MVERHRLMGIGLLGLGLVASCGSSGGGLTIDQVCADLAQARCSKRMFCTNGAGITRTFGDMTTCLTREKLSCTNALAAPMTGNTPSKLQACVAAYSTFSCADFLTNNPPAACIIAGPKPAGASCAFNGQCATTFCGNEKISLCGRCGNEPTAGTSCTATSCGRDKECVSSTLQCQPQGTSGASCGAGLPCGPDLSCIGSTQTTPGTCMADNTTLGAPCSGTTQLCDGTKGLYCAGTGASRMCATIPYVAAGMACGTVSPGAFVGCAGGGNCYTTAGMLAQSGESGSCKAPAADGAPCDTVAGPPCLDPARCVVTGAGRGGTCTVPTGATCL
jgi:hypothetical protein